jgi:hypothetical protein
MGRPDVGPGVVMAPGERGDTGAVIEEHAGERARHPRVHRTRQHPVRLVPQAGVELRLGEVDRHHHPVDRAGEADPRRQLHPPLRDLRRVVRPAEGLQRVGEVDVAAERHHVVLGLLGQSQPRLELWQPGVALEVDERHPEHHARRGLAPGGADPHRGRHRLLGGRAGTGEVAVDRALRGQGGEHQGPGVARLVGEQRGGAFEVAARLVVASGIEQGRCPPLHEQRAALGIGVGSELRERLVEHRERPIEGTGRIGAVPRAAQRLDDVDAAALGGVGHLWPDLECPLEVPQRLGRRVAGGQLRRLDAGHEGSRQVVGRSPVQRERRGDGDVAAGQRRIGRQRLAVSGVDPRPLARERVAVDGVARERMAEDVAALGLVDHQHVVLDGIAERRIEVGILQAGDRGQQPVGHRAAPGRRDAQQLLGGWVQALDAGEQDVAQGQRQLIGVRAALHRVEDLLDEERVALGALMDLVHEPRGRRLAQDGLELTRDLRAAEALELDALHRPDALPSGDERAQRMAAVQLVGAEADDHEHAVRVERAHEQGHEVERRAIGPVEVLDHEHERALGGEPLDHADDQLEQTGRAAVAQRRRAGRAVGVEVGQHLRQLGAGRPDEGIELLGGRIAHERAERVRERAERQALAAHLDATAREHPGARRARALGRLLDEPRLAHAGLAAEEDDCGIARDGGIEGRRQRSQLGVAAHEDRTHQITPHRPNPPIRRGAGGVRRRTPSSDGDLRAVRRRA